MITTPLQALVDCFAKWKNIGCTLQLYGEVCSHVGALLFAIEATVKIRNSATVTEEKAYWLLPANMAKIDYRPIREIDFTGAKTKQMEFGCQN